LKGIWKYTRRERGLEQAERYTDLLTAAFKVLAEAPKSAPACDHIRPGYRRRNVERRMIYFRITDYGIAIIRILHERMDAPHRL
jgi:toxin ParE1/3/4